MEKCEFEQFMTHSKLMACEGYCQTFSGHEIYFYHADDITTDIYVKEDGILRRHGTIAYDDDLYVVACEVENQLDLEYLIYLLSTEKLDIHALWPVQNGCIHISRKDYITRFLQLEARIPRENRMEHKAPNLLFLDLVEYQLIKIDMKTPGAVFKVSPQIKRFVEEGEEFLKEFHQFEQTMAEITMKFLMYC